MEKPRPSWSVIMRIPGLGGPGGGETKASEAAAFGHVVRFRMFQE